MPRKDSSQAAASTGGLNFLITGCNSGFGLVITEAAARAGHLVHATVRDRRRAEKLLALERSGLPIKILEADVTSTEQVEAAAKAASSERPVDILVNNAGYEVVAPIEQLTDADLRAQFETNVLGPVRLIRAVVPAMRARRRGRIINVSSAVGHIAVAHRGAYCASKHAVEALTKSLWLELRPFGIDVAVIVPGAFPTEFVANYVYAKGFDENSPYWEAELDLREKMGPYIAQHKAGNLVGMIADAVLHAATDPNPRLHWIIGSDAVELVAATHAAPFEQFVDEWLGGLGMTQFRRDRRIGERSAN